MTVLDQYDLDQVLNPYKQQSQAVKEQIFDLVLNAGGCITLDDVYNMDLQDFKLLKKQMFELLEIKLKKNSKK